MQAQEFERAADALRDYYLRSHRMIDRIMAKRGASLARTKMLMFIAQEGPLRSTDLASSFGYAPRTVTEAVDGLERDGLVRREPDPVDRRAKRISLTAAGEAAIADTEPLRRHYLERLFRVLTPAECEQLVTLVGRLAAQLDEVDIED